MKLVCCLIMLAVLAGCNARSAQEDKQVISAPAAVAATSAPMAAKPPMATENVVFDVPGLLGKKIDQIKSELGKPSEADAPNLSEEELESHYTKKGYHMVITYNVESRQVESILVASATGKTKDLDKLLQMGNLKPDSSQYGIDSLNRDEQGYYLGLVVTRN